MMASRRGVLGFIAGGLAAAPAMISNAASSLAGLKISGSAAAAGIVNTVSDHDGPVDAKSAASSPTLDDSYKRATSAQSWLRSNIVDRLNRNPQAIAHERVIHPITALSPDIAGMRSISMVNKVRMSRVDQYNHQEYLEMELLKLRYAGVFDTPSDTLWDSLLTDDKQDTYERLNELVDQQVRAALGKAGLVKPQKRARKPKN